MPTRKSASPLTLGELPDNVTQDSTFQQLSSAAQHAGDDVLLQQSIREIEGAYEDHPGYCHPFWSRMARRLTKTQLRRFALHYYPHVQHYRLYLAGAMTIVPADHEPLQVALTELLADEFGVGTDLSSGRRAASHPDLFRRFMRSLGLSPDDWRAAPRLDGFMRFKRAHYDMFRNDCVEESVGAVIFACEQTTPYRHACVTQGIEQFNQRTGDSVDPVFFASHVEIDVHHTATLIAPIRDWLTDVSRRSQMIEGIRRSFDGRRAFLDDLYRKVFDE